MPEYLSVSMSASLAVYIIIMMKAFELVSIY